MGGLRHVDDEDVRIDHHRHVTHKSDLHYEKVKGHPQDRKHADIHVDIHHQSDSDKHVHSGDNEGDDEHDESEGDDHHDKSEGNNHHMHGGNDSGVDDDENKGNDNR